MTIIDNRTKAILGASKNRGWYIAMVVFGIIGAAVGYYLATQVIFPDVL